MTTSKIRIAVVGAGKMGTHHARALSKLPDVELVGVCDTNIWKAQLAAWQSNTVAVRARIEDGLADLVVQGRGHRDDHRVHARQHIFVVADRDGVRLPGRELSLPDIGVADADELDVREL